MTGGWTEMNNEEFYNFYSSSMYEGFDKSDLHPDVFCFMVRIFRLTLVLLYI